MRIVDFVLDLSLSQRDRIAWIERDRDLMPCARWTWNDVQMMAAGMAEFLLDHGVAVGDRVANLYANCLPWAILDIACSAINAIHAPLDPRLSSKQKENCIRQLEPKMVFGEQSFGIADIKLNRFSTILRKPIKPLSDFCRSYSTHDVANILFTSGTTAEPLGVMLSHRNLVTNAIAKLDAMPQTSDDHRLNLIPFAHAYARTCELTTWMVSRSSMESVTCLDDLFRTLGVAQPSLINAVPRVFDEILIRCQQADRTREELSHLLGHRIRQLACGGAGLRKETRDTFAKAGYPIYQGYGLTETSPTVCSNRAPDRNNFSRMQGVGPAVQGVQIRIDEESRLWVAGDGVMRGYWRQPEATTSRIVDGWLDTGDLAEWVEDDPSDSQRSIRILGRSDEMIVLSNGYKVIPDIIEQALIERMRLHRCMLIGNARPFTALLVHQATPPGQSHDPETACPSSAILSLEHVQSSLRDFPQYQIPKCLVLIPENWTANVELCNFKGAVIRHRVERAYQKVIDAAYSITI